MPVKSGRGRKILRAARITILALLLLGIGFLGWLNLFGLPQAAKKRIQAAAAARGLFFDGSSFRLRGFNRIVVRDGILRGTAQSGPSVQARRVELAVDLLEVWRFGLEISELKVTEARIEAPLGGGGDPLVIENASAAISLTEAGLLRVQDVRGRALGIQFAASGAITNCWTMIEQSSGEPTGEVPSWEAPAQAIQQLLKQITGPVAPELKVTFLADASHPERSVAKVEIVSAQGTSPWGKLSDARMELELRPGAQGAVEGEGKFLVNGIELPSGKVAQAESSIVVQWPLSNALPTISARVVLLEGLLEKLHFPSAELTFSAQPTNNLYASELQVDLGKVSSSQGWVESGSMLLRLHREVPAGTKPTFDELFRSNLVGTCRIALNQITSSNLTIGRLEMHGSTTNLGRASRLDLGKLSFLTQWQAELNTELTQMKVGELSVPSVRLLTELKSPELILRDLQAEAAGSRLEAAVALNLTNLFCAVTFRIAVEPAQWADVVQKELGSELKKWQGSGPVELSGSLRTQIPRGVSTWGGLWDGIHSSLQFMGKLNVTGTYPGLRIDALQADLNYTNGILTAPQIELLLPEGHASLGGSVNTRDGRYRLYVNSHINPRVVDPFLKGQALIGYQMARFTEAPEIEGELTGRLGEIDSLRFEGKVRVKNFTIRREPFADGETRIVYTNRVIHLADTLIIRVPGEEARAPEARIEIDKLVMHVRDAVSTANPYVAMKLVGPVTYKAIQPYQFATPPRVTVNGIVPLSDPPKAADLRFEITGQQFTYWRFKLPEATATVIWKGDHLWVTNVVAPFYSGRLDWHGYFFFYDNGSADYQFEGRVREVNANLLLADLLTSTNRIDGTIDGRLVITSANSDSMTSWNGFGNATLRDGFLWDMPVFGIFTPMLESINPGLGVSKVKSGTASFRITNGVVVTRDLEVRAPAFRLQYDGEVDFEGRLKARMEARLLRDTWFVGRLISATLIPLSKIFEAEVSGTLEKPVSTFRHFTPLKALKEMLVGEKDPPEPKESPP